LLTGEKSLTLNLKTPEGKEIFFALLRQSDVLIESFRPGVMKRLGLDYLTLEKENPRIIYCALTGFGQTGPYRDRPGHDINYISIAGVLGNNGAKEGPPVIPGVQIADLSGALMALVGILLALFNREKTGRGQMVDVSMTDAAFFLGVNAAAQYIGDGRNPLRGGERLMGGLACYNVYPTKNGRYISIGALEEKFWATLCKAVGREDLISELNAPPERQEKLIGIFHNIFLSRTLDEWVKILEPLETCFAPVLTIEEAFRDPQLRHREMIFDVDHPLLGLLTQLGLPVKLDRVSGPQSFHAPQTGEHTEEILASLGYGDWQIEDFRQRGIV